MVLTHRLQVLKKFGLPKDTSLSLEELSKLSKIPLEALQEVYNRGIGAYGPPNKPVASVRLKGSFKKNVDAPASMKLSPQNWAFSRVYSFINKSPTTYGKADADIVRKYKL
jgi:hypothetical protein